MPPFHFSVVVRRPAAMAIIKGAEIIVVATIFIQWSFAVIWERVSPELQRSNECHIYDAPTGWSFNLWWRSSVLVSTSQTLTFIVSWKDIWRRQSPSTNHSAQSHFSARISQLSFPTPTMSEHHTSLTALARTAQMLSTPPLRRKHASFTALAKTAQRFEVPRDPVENSRHHLLSSPTCNRRLKRLCSPRVSDNRISVSSRRSYRKLTNEMSMDWNDSGLSSLSFQMSSSSFFFEAEDDDEDDSTLRRTTKTLIEKCERHGIVF